MYDGGDVIIPGFPPRGRRQTPEDHVSSAQDWTHKARDQRTGGATWRVAADNKRNDHGFAACFRLGDRRRRS
jgi:hypothetical protein